MLIFRSILVSWVSTRRCLHSLKLQKRIVSQSKLADSADIEFPVGLGTEQGTFLGTDRIF